MNGINEPTHINKITLFFEEISKQEELTLESIIEKIQRAGIEWNDHEIRLLIHTPNLTPKRKFLILLAAGRISEAEHAYWILLEHLFHQTVLFEGNSVENSGTIGAWIKRNLKTYEGGMQPLAIQKVKSNVKNKFGIRENWYITQQVSKSIDALLKNNYDDLIIIACRFLSIANYKSYLNPACQSIIRLAKLGKTECDKYLHKYRIARLPGIERLENILNHLWTETTDTTDLSSSDVISLISIYKSI